jgi:O-antigen/teichoic acid export membrane protein
MSTVESSLGVASPTRDLPLRIAETGTELKRGAFLNTIAMLASVLRGVFIFLVARLLGPASLGTFSIAWASTDVISKVGIFGLDSALITFLARSEAVGDRSHSRSLFRLAVALAVGQSAAIAMIVVAGLQLLGRRMGLQPEMVSALAVTVCALPGLVLYRICTAASRGMKVMQHDIYSRGITDPVITTLTFLLVFVIGFTTFAPEVAAIAGTAASGVVALALASRLFRHVRARRTGVSIHGEVRRLFSYGAPTSAHQLLIAFITQLDLIMLGWFIGRAPGVTLATVGIYGAVADIAGALRKVNQAFNPIFAPVVARMTATGEQERAAATYARLAQWMLWVLLPLGAVITLAGPTILMIYGPTFVKGSAWLGIVMVTCATNAFFSLGETAIMVQRPRLNLLHSLITGAVAVGATLVLIPRFGVMGAASGVFLAFAVQAALRYATLRFVFGWKHSWNDIRPPVVAAVIAFVPAIVCRLLLDGITGQLASAAAFLAVFGLGWWRHRAKPGTD